MKKLIFILLLSGICMFSVACGNRALQSVSLAEYPSDIHYNVGESFRTEGLKLSVRYTDGTEETVPVTPDMVTFTSATPGACVARIAYTYNGKTETVYVNTIVDNTLGDYRASVARLMTTSELYVAHKDDAGVAELCNTALSRLSLCTTVEEMRDTANDFQTALALLVLDKTEALEMVNSVDISTLTDVYYLLAESERSRVLLEIELASSPAVAVKYATRYREQIEEYRKAEDSLADDATKTAAYGKICEYRDKAQKNRAAYSGESYLQLMSALDGAALRALMAKTKAETEAVLNEAATALQEAHTLADDTYDALCLVYKDGAVRYGNEAAVRHAEEVYAKQNEAGLADIYYVRADQKIAALTYIDGEKIDLAAAVTAMRIRYDELRSADENKTAVTAAVTGIGDVSLLSGDALTAAEEAYRVWRDTYHIDEINDGTAILGNAYTVMTEKRTAYNALVAEVRIAAAEVDAAIAAIGKVNLGVGDAVLAARTAYNAYVQKYGDAGKTYLSRVETLESAETAYNSLYEGATAAGNELKTLAEILRGDAYIEGIAGEDKILEAEEKLNAFKEEYGEEYLETYAETAAADISAARNAYDTKEAVFKAEQEKATTDLKTKFIEIQNGCTHPEQATKVTGLYSEGYGAIQNVTFAEWIENPRIFAELIETAETDMRAAASGT